MIFSLTSALLLSSSLTATVSARASFNDRVYEWSTRPERFAAVQPKPRSLAERSSSYRFLNDATKPYVVDSLPDVPFELGEMYSGNIAINSQNASRNLFFAFYPKIGDPSDDLVIWLNGGPGCSSLEGFLQGNGPFVWQPGTLAPVQNPYTWANLTNMLWVEQPVGVGFSQGEVTATSETDIAVDFLGFLKNFEDLFGIKNYKIYVTGESYAGRYVPYISAAMLDRNDTVYFNLSGALAYDPTIGDYIQTGEYVTIPFTVKNNNILGLNDTFIAQLEGLQQSCGYAAYLEKWYTYPASGVQPPTSNAAAEGECDVLTLIQEALLAVNPCFNIYEITATCPFLSDVLGSSTAPPYSPYNTSYFNRKDVKEAIHAPMDVTWLECTAKPVFVGDGLPQNEGDSSPDPIQSVLPQVIEATNRVLIGNGDWDIAIVSNTTRLAIQNMTWNGKLGFDEKPGSTPILISTADLEYASVFNSSANAGIFAGLNEQQGTVGIQHYERGLMYIETYQSGHQQPQYQPRACYAHMQWLLGQTSVVGS